MFRLLIHSVIYINESHSHSFYVLRDNLMLLDFIVHMVQSLTIGSFSVGSTSLCWCCQIEYVTTWIVLISSFEFLQPPTSIVRIMVISITSNFLNFSILVYILYPSQDIWSCQKHPLRHLVHDSLNNTNINFIEMFFELFLL